ncbi:MAG: hypothetical protein AAFZ65_16030, partial [Planctomycetota bacterium]
TDAVSTALPDLIVAATGTEYISAIYNSATEIFDIIPSPPFMQGLHNATAMQTANLDNQQLEDLITLGGPSGRTLYGWTINVLGAPTNKFSFTVTEDVLDFAPVRLTLPAVGESSAIDFVAVATASGLSVYDQNGELEVGFIDPESDYDAAHLEVLRSDVGSQVDSLAWARRVTGQTTWNLAVQTGSSLHEEGAIRIQAPGASSAADVDVVGLRSGDLDGDGDLDLLVTQSTFQLGGILENVPTGLVPRFDLTSGVPQIFHYTNAPEEPIPGSVPVADFVDVTSDGLADAVVLYEDTHEILIQRSGEQAAADGSSMPAEIVPDGAVARLEYQWDGSNVDDPLRIYFYVPSSTIGSMAGWNHVQVQVWLRDEVSGAIVQDAILNQVNPIGTPGPGETKRRFRLDASLIGEAATPGWALGRQMFITYRLLDATNDGTSVTAILDSTEWLSTAFAISTQPTVPGVTAYRSTLLADPFVIAGTDLDVIQQGSAQGDQGIVLGASVDVGRVAHLVGAPRPGALSLSSDVFFYDPTSAGF